MAADYEVVCFCGHARLQPASILFDEFLEFLSRDILKNTTDHEIHAAECPSCLVINSVVAGTRLKHSLTPFVLVLAID